jgi:hypothetical protein
VPMLRSSERQRVATTGRRAQRPSVPSSPPLISSPFFSSIRLHTPPWPVVGPRGTRRQAPGIGEGQLARREVSVATVAEPLRQIQIRRPPEARNVDLRLLAEPGGALFWDHPPAIDSAWQHFERERPDREN